VPEMKKYPIIGESWMLLKINIVKARFGEVTGNSRSWMGVAREIKRRANNVGSGFD
jgi:hypothetical protein